MEIRQFFLRRRRLFDVTGQETAAARDRKCPVARLSQRDNTCKYNPAGFHGAFNVSRACGMDIARSCDTCARLYTKFSGPKGKPYRALPDLHARPFSSRESLLPLATSFTGFEITIDRTIDFYTSFFFFFLFIYSSTPAASIHVKIHGILTDWSRRTPREIICTYLHEEFIVSGGSISC